MAYKYKQIGINSKYMHQIMSLIKNNHFK